jgi:hemerythrin
MMWKDRYRVGVDLIDRQHIELFRRISDFTQTIRNEENWEEKLDKVKETLFFMKDYVIIHFNAEESYQQRIDFPGYVEHKAIHADFKNTINEYVKLFEEEGFNQEKIHEFGAKLMTWLIMHVGRMDQQVGKYAKSKGGQIK